MAKKKIHVKDEELIKTLNKNLSRKNSQETKNEEVVPTVEPEPMPDTEPEPETVSTEKNVTTPDNDEPDWKRWECIESDLQRQLKFNSYKDKGHASAYPDTDNINDIEKFIIKNGETIKEINERISEVEKPFQPQCGSSNGKLMPDYTFDTETGFSYGIEEKILQCLLNIKKAQKDATEPNTDKVEDTYEMVDHPQHYNNYEYEVIDMMRKIYGDEKTAIFCELNAFKYRMRMGTKPTSPIDEDIKKEQWYLKKKQEILNNKIIIKTDKGTL